ncbi:MAG TPA: protein phosphatase 2C domain-containing protein [Vicinamibacterales bacterium]|nr:protein phosphatase 2C domain-containing protein [Vicinamibacterales bacterium]
MAIRAHGLSDPGPVRKINEDSFFSDPELRLFIVADGLGGHSAGEVASSLAVETIAGFIRRTEDDSELSWPYGIEPALSFAGNVLRTAVHLANRRVFRAAEKHDEYTGMGTTVVAAFMSGSRLAVAHAGDSRLYVLTNGALTQLTRDDTWAATILASQGDGKGVPPPRSMKHVLTNVIGAREQADVHLGERELTPGDMVLLCSDGLHGALDDAALLGLLSSGGRPEDMTAELIQAALARGAKDNVTAVVARYEGD